MHRLKPNFHVNGWAAGPYKLKSLPKSEELFPPGKRNTLAVTCRRVTSVRCAVDRLKLSCWCDEAYSYRTIPETSSTDFNDDTNPQTEPNRKTPQQPYGPQCVHRIVG